MVKWRGEMISKEGKMSEGGGEEYSIGIDLGGTKVEAALLDGEGKLVSDLRYQTQADKGAENIVSELLNAVETLQTEAGVSASAVGVGVAGQVNLTGEVLSAPNLPFKNTRLQERLASKTGLPVIVTNDVRAATFGEWWFGAGKGVDDLVVMFVGTGVGGGVVSGGRLLVGCNNMAGELGHITLVANGRKCRCPNYGCIEAYAGGWAIAERAQEAVRDSPREGRALKSIAGTVDEITAATVSQAYKEGNLLANKIVDKTARYLAAGVVGIVNTFNPCMLILGGGVIEGLNHMIPIVEDTVKKQALRPSLEDLQIVKAGLGGKAGVVGAAAFAKEKSRGVE
ncbi:MAG TPA: ROK family protein [Euryarchaeota archaeon]|nr:ROK family protein [Euryarchaeota archaeon]